jgi:hypothetical protein
MSGEGGTALSKLEAAAREFQAREERAVDLKEFRAIIDALKNELALSIARADEIQAEL